MGLPEHSCISCAYLIQSDHDTISREQREQALIDENNGWSHSGINYQSLVCCKGQADYSRINTHSVIIDIRNDIIKPNSCEDWMIFQDISPQDMELSTSNKLAKISVIVAKKSLALAFAGMVITFVITLIIWYLD